MKALASTSPSFATVKVNGRAARKHYGVMIQRPYEHGVHEFHRQYWSAYEGRNMVMVMDWFIKKVNYLAPTASNTKSSTGTDSLKGRLCPRRQVDALGLLPVAAQVPWSTRSGLRRCQRLQRSPKHWCTNVQ